MKSLVKPHTLTHTHTHTHTHTPVHKHTHILWNIRKPFKMSIAYGSFSRKQIVKLTLS